MHLIIITGLPGTGKTTLAKTISKALSIPLFYKDGIKEHLFDSIEHDHALDHQQLGMVGIETLYYIAEQFCAIGNSLIIESNFNAQKTSPRINKLKNDYNFSIIQIRCYCDGNILLERFQKRHISGNRHIMHKDDISHNILLQGAIDPLEISCDFIDIDTSDFDLIDYNHIVSQIITIINNQ